MNIIKETIKCLLLKSGKPLPLSEERKKRWASTNKWRTKKAGMSEMASQLF